MKPACFWMFLFVLPLSSCSDDNTPASAPDNGSLNVLVTEWVATEPTQCLTNAWEQDWLASHDNDYAGYPGGKGGTLTPEEIQIVTGYYARQGVVVYGTSTAPKYTGVCLACDCPQGHTLFLEVRDSDVATMLSLGYRQENPPGGAPAMEWNLGRR